MVCRNCNTPMEHVMSFSKEKYEKFNKCPKCHSETKHQNLNKDELDFGEELGITVHKKYKGR